MSSCVETMADWDDFADPNASKTWIANSLGCCFHACGESPFLGTWKSLVRMEYIYIAACI